MKTKNWLWLLVAVFGWSFYACSDSENDKSTYVSLLGIDKCRELVKELTESAINSLSVFENDTQALEDLALSLANRNN
jgi:geranylgeranyl diphosphate synthase type II